MLVKPFLEHVTESELFAIMTGGFASIAGAITATIIDLGVSFRTQRFLLCVEEAMPYRVGTDDLYYSHYVVDASRFRNKPKNKQY